MSKQTMSILLVVIGLVVVYFVFFKNKDQKESGYKKGTLADQVAASNNVLNKVRN